MLVQGEVQREQVALGKPVLPPEFFQDFRQAVQLSGIVPEGNIQRVQADRKSTALTRELRRRPVALDDQVYEAGHIENGRDVGGWPGDQQHFLIVFHLPVVLQQDPYPG